MLKLPDPITFTKLYSLADFAEINIAAPIPLNYTWHELAKRLSKDFPDAFGGKEPYINQAIWNPHFNYIDFQVWHRFLINFNITEDLATILLDIKKRKAKKNKKSSDAKFSEDEDDPFDQTLLDKPTNSIP